MSTPRLRLYDSTPQSSDKASAPLWFALGLLMAMRREGVATKPQTPAVAAPRPGPAPIAPEPVKVRRFA